MPENYPYVFYRITAILTFLCLDLMVGLDAPKVILA